MNSQLAIEFAPFPEFNERPIQELMPQGYCRRVQKNSRPIMVNPADVQRLLLEGKEVMACQDFWFTSPHLDYFHFHLGLKDGMPACFRLQQKWSRYIDWSFLSTLTPRWSNHGLIFTNLEEDTLTTTDYGYIEGLKVIVIGGTNIYLPIPKPRPFKELISVPHFCHLKKNFRMLSEPTFPNQDGVQIFGIISETQLRIIDKRVSEHVAPDARKINSGRLAVTFMRDSLINMIQTLDPSFDVSQFALLCRDDLAEIIKTQLESIGHLTTI